MTIDGPETLPGWPFPWPAFAPDWDRAALLVVDLQRYGCDPSVGLGAMLLRRHPAIAATYLPRITDVVLPSARRLLDAFRAAELPVLFTRHGPLLPDGSDMIARRRRRDDEALVATDAPALWHKGTPEHEIVPSLAPLPGEVVLDKNTSGAFGSTGIEGILRNLDVRTLVVCGMATDMCVETTARDAADRGFDVIVVEDATATFVPAHHEAALSAFARTFGQVWTTERVLSVLATRTGQRAAQPPHPPT